MKIKRLFTLLVGIVVLMASAIPAFAHEHRELEGDVTLAFGWREEPALSGLFNGPEVFVEKTSTEEPIEGAELKAEVTFGDETVSVEFYPAWGEPGHYIAELIPLLPGDYSFHVTGTIGDVTVDEVFTSADGEFSTVEPVTDVMFPQTAITDSAALVTRITELEARLAELEAALAELQAAE